MTTRRQLAAVCVSLVVVVAWFVSILASGDDRRPIDVAPPEVVEHQPVESAAALATDHGEREAFAAAPSELAPDAAPDLAPAADPNAVLGRIHGRVTDAAGAPVRASCNLQRASDDEPGGWTGVRRVAADASGEFVVEVRSPGRYRVHANHDAHGTAVYGPLVFGGAPRDLRADLTLRGGGVLAGIVRDRTDAAVPHIELRAVAVTPEAFADGNGDTARTFETDRAGRFRVAGLVDGAFTIQALRFGHWSRAETLTPTPVRADGAELELVSSCSRLVVRVRDANGDPVRTSAGPTTRGGDPAPHAVYVTALADGDRVVPEWEHELRAELRALPGGAFSAEVEAGFRYAVGVVSREYELVERVVAIDDTGTQNVELRLGPRARGTELDPTLSVEGTEVTTWFPATHELRSPRTGALLWRSRSFSSGTVSIGPGRYSLRSFCLAHGTGHMGMAPHHDRWAPAERLVDVAPGVVTPVEVDLQRTGVLALHVIAPDQPLARSDLPVVDGPRVSDRETRRRLYSGVRVRLEHDGAPLHPVFDVHAATAALHVSLATGWVPPNHRAETARGIPSGNYRLIVEREDLGTIERDVEIRAGETTEVRLSFAD